MGRSGYSDCCDDNECFLWLGALARSMKGKRGQAFLREALRALDAMPEKKLIAGDLVDDGGGCCLMGAVAASRGADVSGIDPEDRKAVAAAMGIAPTMAAEIAFNNDDEFGYYAQPGETPEERFARMRAWIVRHINVTADELI